MFEKYKDEEILIIAPNATKLDILKDMPLVNVKFMTIEEFMSNYYFDYSNNAIDYLMTTYKYHIDVAKVIIKNLYDISINKEYKSDKLNLLKKIKLDLLNNNLLIINNNFKTYLTSKKIIVKNYYRLEKYIYDDLISLNADIKKINKSTINNTIIRTNTLEEEIVFIALEIIKLLKKGININNIYLTNVLDSDYYTLKKVFKYFNIPLTLNSTSSIYGTTIVNNYLSNNYLDLTKNDKITKKLVNVINSLVEVSDSINYKAFLKDKLKTTKTSSLKLINSVNIVDLLEKNFTKEDYVFCMGVNQDILPITYKDEDYITDSIKDEINYYDTNYKNINEKKVIKYVLSNINNLTLSYRLKDSFSTYLKSSIINELNLEEKIFSFNDYKYSNIYNKLLLSSSFDNYYKYNHIDKSITNLYATYHNIPYNTYSNQYNKINSNKLKEYIKKPFKLSYTSINSYNKCRFSFYIKNILKIDKYNETFSTLIGNLFHFIATSINKDNFNFNQEWDKYLEDKTLSIKEVVLLENLKLPLKKSIDTIFEQQSLSKYNDYLYEKTFNINLDNEIDSIFTGNIDKIILRKNVSDTYFSLIDYKTGGVNTSILNMKYGLDLQLPSYLYLMSSQKEFTSPIFTGMYYQRVLYPKIKFDKKKSVEDIIKDNLKLNGYSTTDQEELEKYDTSYNNSVMIKSMKTKKTGEFYHYTKTLNEEDIYNIIKYVEKIICDNLNTILDADFRVNPKSMDSKNISCEYCNFKDICYMNSNDLEYLDKVEDLEYLKEA